MASPDQDIPFDRSVPESDGVAQVSPRIRRLTAPNPGPFTFTGTCTYIVGHGEVALIDPGPADERHIAAVLAAVRGETVRHIVVTHTHRDHSPAAADIRRATGAPIVGCALYEPARALAIGEINLLDAANDADYAPDIVLGDGETIATPQYTLSAVATPGHTMNHLAFALHEEEALFSGDHVMGWSTSIVAPPDGSMQAYMASLERLLGRSDRILWPGHGGPVNDPQRFVRALFNHRRFREAAILARVEAGDSAIETIVARIYTGLDPRLTTAAALSVFAHMEDLVNRGLVATEGPVTLTAAFRLAGERARNG
jgi:glyoxylase-like metal-dependent hydrolase (beta-lactamase superfamily II)